MARVGIVAAMFREVHPLLRTMKPLKYLPDKRVRLYEDQQKVIAYAGMGMDLAAVACRAVLATGELSAIASVGWAGGLNPKTSGGEVVEPSVVIDGNSGERFSANGTGGTLVTVQRVAGLEEKRQIGERFGGDYVDMEAAVVAESAQQAGVPFYCFKAISDAHDARLPDMNRFNRNGKFSVWRFMAHVGVRPSIWGAISEMSQASLQSRDALCRRLTEWVQTMSFEKSGHEGHKG
jgi:adenosylhomocysteine nucleosidase